MAHINSFTDEYRFLSNFYMTPVVYDGSFYPSSEHAYQAAKTLDLVQREQVQNVSTAGQSKRLGRKVTMRPDWDKVKLEIMFQIVLNKFINNDKIRKELLNTGYSILEEGNTRGDTYWGVCNGEGKNFLGQILMEVRAIIRAI